jgi:glycosyltransferase involved in cell wall biosynthesis
MKILLTSYVFAPSIGGIETVSALLAPEFVQAGHEVKLVTKTGKEDSVSRPYEVVRNPSPRKLLELTRWCDVFFQNNISLELAWPLLFVRRPWVIAHHTWIDLAVSWKVRLKRSLLHLAHHATISRPIADSLLVPSTIVGNPYATEIFRLWPDVRRDKELVFLGRLVSDKGIDLLVDALAMLRPQGLTPKLTVIGSGPEREPLRRRAERLKVGDQIEFTGPQTGVELARTLNAHQIMVIPSRWAEPFGVVALEGIACGCMVVASRNGGLIEAVGPCGIFFETENCESLVEALRRALTQPGLREHVQSEAPAHLHHFGPADVASRYLEVFKRAVDGSQA